MKNFRSLLLGMTAVLALTPVVASAATDSGSLTIGGANWGNCGGPLPQVANGYYSGIMGAYSPTTLTGGSTVEGVYDVTAFGCGQNQAILVITGFASDPGQSWLTSVTCNGVTNSSGAATYSYSGGMSFWNWTTKFGFLGRTSASCSITHN